MAEAAQILIRARDETAAAWASAQANASQAIDGIKSLVPGLAAALTGAGLVAFAKGALDAADHMNDLSKATNISVEDLSGLQLLAKQTGTDLDGLAKGINRMSVEMGKAPEKFRALGVTATDSIGAFKQFADIFNTLPDISQRNALAQAVFHRSWQEIAPALAEGSRKIGDVIEAGTRASGMTSELARKSDELNDKWALLFRTGALGNAVLKELIDPLTAITDQMLAASKASSGFLDTMAKFALVGGDQAKDPAGAIAAIDVQLKALHKTGDEFDAMSPLLKWFSADDIAIINTQIAALEKQRQVLAGLGGETMPGAAAASGGAPVQESNAAANAAARAAAFLDNGAALKHQWDLTHLLIDASADWNAQVKDHIEIVHRLEDAQGAASLAHLEQLQREEDSAQGQFVAMQEASYNAGLDERNRLVEAAQFENEQFSARLSNLNVYLSMVRASTSTSLALQQGLEVRHQQTLLQIERDKNNAVRSMQVSTWQAAGELLQSFSGKSQAAAIAVIAINKGLAIAQTIQATAVATMRAFSDLGPIAGAAAAAEIQALGAVQIGLIAATGLLQASQVGGGGAAAGSPANPVNTTTGSAAPFTQALPAAPGNAQTTIVNFQGTADERKLLKRFVDMLNENSRDGGKILTT